MKTLLIILITSLFWALGIYIDRNYSDAIKAEIMEWAQDGVADTNKSVAETTTAATTKRATPAPKAKATATAKPQTPAKNYAELICGYWLPVEGTECKLEISKYGTITRDYKIYSSWHKDRYEYTISGNKFIVNDYYKCTVNVFDEGGVTYLEIFGHEKYAGKYRKR